MRLRTDLAYGTVTDDPLLVGATSLNSAELPRLGNVIDSPDIMAVVLDPRRLNGEPEFVHVTAYDGSATSGTILRAAENAADYPAREHPAGTEWAHVATDRDFEPALLAVKSYSPGSTTTVPTSSTSLVDVDATNLAVSFVVPDSGSVLVRLSAVCFVNTTGGYLVWGLREGSSNVSGSQLGAGFTSAWAAPYSRPVRISGLTPGAAHTWKWAQRAGTISEGTVNTRYGGESGPAVMEVWRAP